MDKDQGQNSILQEDSFHNIGYDISENSRGSISIDNKNIYIPNVTAPHDFTKLSIPTLITKID